MMEVMKDTDNRSVHGKENIGKRYACWIVTLNGDVKRAYFFMFLNLSNFRYVAMFKHPDLLSNFRTTTIAHDHGDEGERLISLIR
jgi:hypothetical protein